MQYVSSTEHAYLGFQWDPRLISFLESLEYHGRETVMNLLRGPGFIGTGRGGIKSFDWQTGISPFQVNLHARRSVVTQLVMAYTNIYSVHS